MILCIIQARTSSARLPGKVLKPLLGQPMLLRQGERARRSRRIDRLLVATSEDCSDDCLAALCDANDLACYRGSLDDVLDRFYRAASGYAPDQVVRLTGDCPLTDPGVVDRVIEHHLAGGFDYTSNTIEPTYPDGLDVEVFNYASLKRAWREAELPSEREHVTPFIINRPHLFRLGSHRHESDLSGLRWTVDEPVDYLLVRLIFENLYPRNSCFSLADILAYIEAKPELKTINSAHRRNEGYEQSLQEDLIFRKSR